MRLLLRAGLAGLALVCLAPLARADVVVRAPFVYVRVGGTVEVCTPWVRVVVPGRTRVVRAAPRRATPVVVVPGDPPPVPADAAPGQVVPPVAQTAPAVKPPTVAEFARTFKAAPGRTSYEAVLTHPCTGRPVKVCFSLPGCPRRVKCSKNTVTFRYGLVKSVVLNFERDGSVRVRGF
jgi:hypothetical protein